MNLFGLQITRAEKAVPTTGLSNLAPIPSRSWFGTILESFTGAWQQNVAVDNRETTLAQSTVWACIDRIATDFSIFRPMLLNLDENGVGTEAERSPFQPVLRKPNHYQTRIQFYQQWIISKLIYGNTYVLLERDNRGGEFQGVVRYMYILNPEWVTPLISASGELYYQLSQDPLKGLLESIVVPASEIIHDRMSPMLGNDMCGTSPLYSSAMSATQSRKIQNSSSVFFANMARPSGVLSADGQISDETAARLKQHFEANFGGANLGRLLVLGDGLRFAPMSIPADQSQLVEQLKWTEADVAKSFHVPLYKLGIGEYPTYNNIAALNQEYYNQCLQPHVEAIEELFIHAFRLRPDQDIEFDTDVLLRMDPKTRAEVDHILVQSAIRSPNEARVRWNHKPVIGGESPMIQEQNYSLAALAKRDAKDDPFAKSSTSSGNKKPATSEEAAKDVSWMTMPVAHRRAIFENSLRERLQ